jgi:hypothetical protein
MPMKNEGAVAGQPSEDDEPSFKSPPVTTFKKYAKIRTNLTWSVY